MKNFLVILTALLWLPLYAMNANVAPLHLTKERTWRTYIESLYARRAYDSWHAQVIGQKSKDDRSFMRT